jgi:hypothetical protein
MNERCYVGKLDTRGVTVDGADLDPCVDLRSHSSGFDWGRKSPGALQLALAILVHHFGGVVSRGGTKSDSALRYYQAFYHKLIIELQPEDGFTLLTSEVRDVLAEIDADRLDRGEEPRKW